MLTEHLRSIRGQISTNPQALSRQELSTPISIGLEPLNMLKTGEKQYFKAVHPIKAVSKGSLKAEKQLFRASNRALSQ